MYAGVGRKAHPHRGGPVTALRARWRPEHEQQPVIVSTRADIESLIDTLAEVPGENDLAAVLHPLTSIQRGLPAGGPGPQLLVGVNRRELVGSVRLTLFGFWYARSEATPGRTDCAYHLLGCRQAFPADAVISLDEMVWVIEDLLVDGERRRPPSVVCRLDHVARCPRPGMSVMRARADESRHVPLLVATVVVSTAVETAGLLTYAWQLRSNVCVLFALVCLRASVVWSCGVAVNSRSVLRRRPRSTSTIRHRQRPRTLVTPGMGAPAGVPPGAARHNTAGRPARPAGVAR